MLGDKLLFFNQNEVAYAKGTGRAVIIKTFGNVADSTEYFPSELTVAGKSAYFFANGRSELWRTDGSTAGTLLLSSAPASSLSQLTAAGKLAFFLKDSELWVTDGSSSGTRRVAQSVYSIIGGSPKSLFFNTFKPTSGGGVSEIATWMTDGTAAGTHSLKNRFFTEDLLGFAGGVAIFASGNVLWRSDGTDVGTFILQDFGEFSPAPFVGDGNTVYFTVPNADEDYEVWHTDGSAKGTFQMPDAPTNINSFSDTSASIVNGSLFFSATNDSMFSLHRYFPGGATLSGSVFKDLDGDGVREAADLDFGGYKVFLDQNGDGICNTNEAFARANSNGRFRFDALPPRKYRLRITPVPNRRATTPVFYDLTLPAAASRSRTFGQTYNILISGRVFEDLNSNGVIDAGEVGLASVTVFVDADNDGVPDSDELSVLTDAAGRYAITALPSGTFNIRVHTTSSSANTVPGSGRRTVTLSSGQVAANVNFGQRRIA